MSAEIQKIAIQLDADKRLVAAAGGAARYVADAAGLASPAAADFQAAVIDVCDRELMHLAGARQRLEIRVTRSAGAVEVAVMRPAFGRDAGEPSAVNGVDRVQHETQNGMAITRLTVFRSASASGA